MAKEPSSDVLFSTIQRGVQAEAHLAGFGQEIQHRCDLVVNRLLASYRNKTLTDQEAMMGIAELAGLRFLLADLDSKVRQGQEAERHLAPTIH